MNPTRFFSSRSDYSHKVKKVKDPGRSEELEPIIPPIIPPSVASLLTFHR